MAAQSCAIDGRAFGGVHADQVFAIESVGVRLVGLLGLPETLVVELFLPRDEPRINGEVQEVLALRFQCAV